MGSVLTFQYFFSGKTAEGNDRKVNILLRLTGRQNIKVYNNFKESKNTPAYYFVVKWFSECEVNFEM